MLLPIPIATSPPIMHQIQLSTPSRQVGGGLCYPYIKIGGTNLRYDIFIEAVADKNVKGVCMTNNQQHANILMMDNSHESIIFPENYDIVSFLFQNNIPVEIKESHEKTSVIDIISILIQIAFIKVLSSLFYPKKQAATEDIILDAMKATNYLNSEMHNFIQFTYNFGRVLSGDELEMLIRNINCKIYLNNRKLRKLFRKPPKQKPAAAP